MSHLWTQGDSDANETYAQEFDSQQARVAMPILSIAIYS